MTDALNQNKEAHEFVKRFAQTPEITKKIGQMLAPSLEGLSIATAEILELEKIFAKLKYELPPETTLKLKQLASPESLLDEKTLAHIVSGESARIAELMARASEQLSKAVIADIKTPTSEALLTAAKRLDVGGGANVSAFMLPPNLLALAGEDDIVTRVYDFIKSQLIPLHSIPTAAIAIKLLNAETEEERLEIIEDHADTLLSRCGKLLSEADLDIVSDEVAHFNEARAAFDAGLYRASMTASAGLIDAGVRRRAREAGGGLKLKRGLVTSHSKDPKVAKQREQLLDEMKVLEYCAWTTVWNAYTSFDGDAGDPPPTIFNRHACAHSVKSCQYSRVNAIIGLMIAALVVIVLDRCDGEAWKLSG